MKLKELCDVLPFRRYELIDKNADMFGYFEIKKDGYYFYVNDSLCSTSVAELNVYFLIPEDDVVVIDIDLRRKKEYERMIENGENSRNTVYYK